MDSQLEMTREKFMRGLESRGNHIQISIFISALVNELEILSKHMSTLCYLKQLRTMRVGVFNTMVSTNTLTY